MNAVLTERFVGAIGLGGSTLGTWFFRVTLFSEAALLIVAAQAGFIDGPRVMSNMATDSWLPHRFAQLSERLTMQYGVLLIAGASVLTLLYAHGHTQTLVLMYAINVFVTFSISQIAMLRFWALRRRRDPLWWRHGAIHVVGLVMCLTILIVNVVMKFEHGAWLTVAATSVVIGVCFLIRRHYRHVQTQLKRLDVLLDGIPMLHEGEAAKAVDPGKPTAVMLVGGYGGLGIHTLLTVQRLFPDHFQNFLFVGIGVIDSASFKGVEEVEKVRSRTKEALERYVALAKGLGLAADFRMDVGTEVVDVAESLCKSIAEEFPRSLFFAGKLVFQQERWYQRLLHNETAYAVQRRLQFAGLNAMVLAVRVMDS